MRDAARAQGLQLPAWRSEFIPAANWLTKNVIRFPPLETEDFYIYGTHEDTPPKTSKTSYGSTRLRRSVPVSTKPPALVWNS